MLAAGCLVGCESRRIPRDHADKGLRVGARTRHGAMARRAAVRKAETDPIAEAKWMTVASRVGSTSVH